MPERHSYHNKENKENRYGKRRLSTEYPTRHTTPIDDQDYQRERSPATLPNSIPLSPRRSFKTPHPPQQKKKKKENQPTSRQPPPLAPESSRRYISLDYDDRLSTFSVLDPTAKNYTESDIKLLRKKREPRKQDYRPMTRQAKEELRKMLHTTYKSMLHQQEDTTLKTLIQKINHRINTTLVPMSFPPHAFDSDHATQKKTKLMDTAFLQLQEKTEIELDRYYHLLDMEKIKLQLDQMESNHDDDDSLPFEMVIIIIKHIHSIDFFFLIGKIFTK
ncbi:uncharacterized protein BX664DRAFT_313853 [Halteromyces radiatus]|uniref:uncharacterized protein n=1 Tax=Halteromyces radiatus TaxID=101107 RepID=UPI00221FDD64|nr:uncharacterized protein BX664DRAFT_313853 [Halteromyces radiatus]KAI8093845.1 hypothetical protein BX664DRAFT_313853 [Halteromyces radiatus]